MDIKTVAEWMTREIKGQKELFQAEAAEMILLLFGEDFVSDGRAKYRGSLKINKDVRRLFRAMNPNAVWDSETFSWKLKRHDAC